METHVHLLRMPIFEVQFALVVMDDLTGIPAPICKRWFEDGATPPGKAKACTLSRGPCVAMLFERPVSHAMVAHELHHATCAALNWCGVQNEETEAFVCGWLAKWVYPWLQLELQRKGE